MTRPVFTPSVGTKFFEDGSVRGFPGSSIVSLLTGSSGLCTKLERLTRAALAQPFGAGFAALGVSSYHVTLFDLVCGQVRESELWSSHLPLDCPLEEADALFTAAVRRDVEWPAGLRMRVVQIIAGRTTLHMAVEPADPAVGEALIRFRDQLASATGVRRPNHETYRFHISLAYLLRVLDEEQQAAYEAFATDRTPELVDAAAPFDLDPPGLVFFDDMFGFPGTRG